MIELVVPGDSNELGPNKRLHWQAKRRLVQQWRERSQIIARNALHYGLAKAPESRVQISFIVRRGRRLDPDNAAASSSLKALVDGLRDAGLLADDTAKHCTRGAVDQEISKEYKQRPSVVVRLEPLDE